MVKGYPLLFLIFFIPFFTPTAQGQSSDSVVVQGYNFEKLRFGGYGEILYQHMDYGADRYSDPSGAPSERRAFISLPRSVFAFDYKFRRDIILTAEIEFEYGGTGSSMELEYEESGEYEMEVEKGGEVVLEQLLLTKLFNPYFNIRMGHLIVPVGITNARHESIRYFGTVRPESETSIIPLTWHETGLSVFGNYKSWSYQVMIINGLDANGFSSAYWVREGKQSIFENAKMTDPAFAFRVENTWFTNLRISASGYMGNSTGNTAKPKQMEHLDGNVHIISGDIEYKSRALEIRANVLHGNLTDSYEISAINKTVSKNIQYQRTPVAKNALAYGAELGYHIRLSQPGTRVTPFLRYEYYNSMEDTESDMHADVRYQRDIITGGLNYYLTPAVAIKMDFSHRRIGMGDYNDENTFGLSVVYTDWFITK